MKALVATNEIWRFAALRALQPIWPAAAFSGLGPVRSIELPDKPAPPPGWARVRVTQCGLCASDIHLLRGDVAADVAPTALLGAPHTRAILGHELVGVVETPSGDFAAGMRVISRSGAFRNCFNLGVPPCAACATGEYAQCRNQGAPPPASEPWRSGGFAPLYDEAPENLLPVPAELTDDEAVLAEPLACALRAVLKLPARELRRVLVIGAGLQGLGAVHWLKALRPGCETWSHARHEFQAALARKLGATQVCPGRMNLRSLADQLKSRIVERPRRNPLLLDGFDAVIDSIASPASLQTALRVTRPGGTVILLGAHLHSGRLDYSPIWFREIDVRGVYAHGPEDWHGAKCSTLELAMQLLAGTARLPVPLVTHHLPLRHWDAAVRLAERKANSQAIRIALMPG